MPTQPTSPTPAPSAIPQRNDRITFAKRMDQFITWVSPIGTEFMALATNAYNNAVDAYNSALAAAASSLGAAGYAQDAANSANTAAQIAGATKWIAGTNYGDGVAVWSPASYLAYRKQGAGMSNIDPGINVTGWVPLTPAGGGTGGAIITGDIVLSASSPAAMVVAPTMHGKYAILPDGTTLSKGVTQYAFYNQSEIPFGIKNKAAVILGWVPPFSGASLLLADNATPASVWGGIGLDKIAVTSEFQENTPYIAYGTFNKTVVIDATREMLISDRGWCVVHDSSDNTYGGIVRATTNIETLRWDAILASPTKILLVSNNSLDVIEAVVLTVTGKAITVNSGSKATRTLASNVYGVSRLVTVGGSFAIALFRTGSIGEVIGISVGGGDGVTATLGVPVELDTTVPSYVPLIFVTGVVIRVVYMNAGFISCTPLTINGATLTKGTFASTPLNSQNSTRAFVNENANVIVSYPNGSYTYVAVFKLTGMTEAVSATSSTNYAASAGSQSLCYLHPLPNNRILVVNRFSGEGVKFTIMNDNAGLSTWVGELSMQTDGASINNICALAGAGNTFNLAVVQADVTQVMKVNCSGANPTMISVNKFSKPNNIGYPYTSPDSYGNLYYMHARSATKDYFLSYGYGLLGFLCLSDKSSKVHFNPDVWVNMNGRNNSTKWLTVTGNENLGCVLRKIEVAE